MKKNVTLLSLLIAFSQVNAQTVVADFETFTLSPNSAYSPTTSLPFQTANAVFNYNWNSDWNYWEGGLAYTNVKDSSTAGFANEYGVRAYNGYSNSNYYVIGLDESVIKLSAPQTTVTGFYVTNTTYAYKSMAMGDQFARKFGDTTGTGSGTTIAQGSYPDYFKLVVKGYLNGILKNDSVTFLLADFTFTNHAQDYILDSWQFVNTANLGVVDSIQFFMRSSDIGDFGINTPLYFALDNFETKSPSTVDLSSTTSFATLKIYPNPFQSELRITNETPVNVIIKNLQGEMIYQELKAQTNFRVNFQNLPDGIYFMEVKQHDRTEIKKIVKY